MDPDPDWIRIQWGPWIRIRIRIQEGKNDPKNIAEVFSCSLNIRKLQSLIKKKISHLFFSSVLVIKTLDPDSLEMLDPDPFPEMSDSNTDCSFSR